jgi:hypothetical protein
MAPVKRRMRTHEADQAEGKHSNKTRRNATGAASQNTANDAQRSPKARHRQKVTRQRLEILQDYRHSTSREVHVRLSRRLADA